MRKTLITVKYHYIPIKMTREKKKKKTLSIQSSNPIPKYLT